MVLPTAHAAPVWFDLSDLVEHLRRGHPVSGIQRVQLDLVQAAWRDHAPRLRLCTCDPQHGLWRRLPAEMVIRLAAEPDSARYTEARDHVLRAATQAPPAQFEAGALLVNPGTAWWLPDQPRMVRAARQHHGIRYAVLVHDCVPLLYPELCADGLPAEYTRWFASLPNHADYLLATSRQASEDLCDQLAQLLPGASAVALRKLIRRLPLDAAPPAALRPASVAMTPLPRDHVLFVGTLEPRKDHMLVLRAWAELVHRHGMHAVPNLLCVGRQGWLCEDVLALHAGSLALRQRVQLLHTVSDSALDGLYRQALFTVYNSHYEGWGLPVTESRAYRKVPVIPRLPALQEAAGGAGACFAPGNLDDLLAVLERMIFDPGARREQEEALAAAPLRHWADLAQDVMALADDAGAAGFALPARDLAPQPGRLYRTVWEDGARPGLDMTMADMIRDLGCAPPRAGGIRFAAGLHRLRLPLHHGLMNAGALRLTISIQAPDDGAELRLRLRQQGVAEPVFRPVRLAPRQERRLLLRIVPDGTGDLLLDVQRDTTGGGDAIVTSFMLCREDDLQARLGYVDQVRALPPAPVMA